MKFHQSISRCQFVFSNSPAWDSVDPSKVLSLQLRKFFICLSYYYFSMSVSVLCHLNSYWAGVRSLWLFLSVFSTFFSNFIFKNIFIRIYWNQNWQQSPRSKISNALFPLSFGMKIWEIFLERKLGIVHYQSSLGHVYVSISSFC